MPRNPKSQPRSGRRTCPLGWYILHRLEVIESSQYKMAKDTGISRSLISKYVSGSRKLTARTSITLAKYLGVKTADLLVRSKMEGGEFDPGEWL